jgi:hypothetical protein
MYYVDRFSLEISNICILMISYSSWSTGEAFLTESTTINKLSWVGLGYLNYLPTVTFYKLFGQIDYSHL